MATTGATEFIDLTTADKYLEEKWSKMVTAARDQNFVFAGHVNTEYRSELKKGQILRIQNKSHFTAQSKTINSAISFETVTETEATITISNYYYSAFALEDVIKPMVSVDQVNLYVPELGYALALQEDDNLAAFVDDFSQSVGTLGVELTYDNLVRGDQYLNDANAPQEERVLIISPAQKAGFLKLDQFIHKDYADIRKGLVGNWMGQYPIFVSTNVEGTNAAGHDNCMMHKSAIGHITQIEPTVKSYWDIDYFAAKFAALTTWGTSEIRDDHGVWMKGA